MADDFDFGFTAVDEPEDRGTPTPTQPSVNNDEVLDEIKKLEAKLLQIDNSGMVDEHKALVEQDVATKLRDVEDLVLPLLYNLQKNPEKEYIHWPNRTAIIDKQIEKIAGARISWIFDVEGEEKFRERESEILSTIIDNDNCVISTGGGIILKDLNRELIKKGTCIELETSIQSQLERTKK